MGQQNRIENPDRFTHIWKLITNKDEREKTRHGQVKYLQSIYLIKHEYPEYIRNSQNATIGKQSTYKMVKRYKQTLHQRRYMNGR